jgi:hypothetical protein
MSNVISPSSSDESVDEFLQSIDIELRKHLVNFAQSENIKIKKVYIFPDDDTNYYPLAFRKYRCGNCSITNLGFSGLFTTAILKKYSSKSHNFVINDFVAKIHKYLSFFGYPEKIEKKSATFGLNENFKALDDIEYYEVAFKSSGDMCNYFYVRFYMNPIKPFCEKRIFPEKDMATLEIRTDYNNSDHLLVSLLNNYKDEISKILGYKVEQVDHKVVQLIDIMMI